MDPFPIQEMVCANHEPEHREGDYVYCKNYREDGEYCQAVWCEETHEWCAHEDAYIGEIKEDDFEGFFNETVPRVIVLCPKCRRIKYFYFTDDGRDNPGVLVWQMRRVIIVDKDYEITPEAIEIAYHTLQNE